MGWTLAIDYGTSNTAAAIALDGGAPQALLVDGAPRLSSLVVLDDDGTLVVGRKAENLVALRPEAVERAPKRRLGVVETVVLGDREVEVAECVAAVLRPVVKEALRQAGQEAPDRVVLTHPAAWTAARTDPLRDAAARAGVPDVELLEEPVAAARHYAAARVATGGYVAVYDLGGGTFDTAVLQRAADGFVLAGKGGDQELGGEDFDERLATHVAELIEELDAELWARTLAGEEIDDRRRLAAFRQEVRTAKEVLSDSTVYSVVVPNLAHDLRVTRAELEDLVREPLQSTVSMLRDTIRDAGVAEDALAAVYMTGGGSRMPLAETLVFEVFGRRPTTYGDPKGVVALGAARPVATDEPNGAATTPTPAPVEAAEPGDAALAGAEERLRERRRDLEARQRAAELEERRLDALEAEHRVEEEAVRSRLTGMEQAHRAEEDQLRGELNELERGHREEERAGRAELDTTRPHDLEAVWIRLEDGLVRHDWDTADAASIEIVLRYAGGQVGSHARAARIPDEVLTTLDERWQELGSCRLRDRRWVWSGADGVAAVPLANRFNRNAAETALAKRLRDIGR
jgi:actin-like ATPase involved in cell morphogenesis